MKKQLLWILAFAVIILGVVIGYQQYNKPHREAADESPAVSITAAELLNLFQNDENQANTLYLNKVLEVKGVVSGISEQDKQNLTVFLETGNEPSVISCEISPNQIPDPLPTPGDQVIVKGICTGYTMDVVLVRCTIINQ
jgi:uncharacterized protein YpmB